MVNCIACGKSFLDDEDAFVGWLAQGGIYVVNLQFLVLHETVHALSNHTQAFLDNFLKGAADGHYFADGFHRRTQFAVNATEFAEVPAGEFADHVVEGRFEESAGCLRHGVLQVEEAVAQSQLSGHEGEGIARGFGCEGRRAAEAGVHLNDAVVFGVGVERVLHVTFANDAHVAHDADGQFAQLVKFAVGQCLRGSDDDTLARVDAEGVEVLHVADGDAVVKAVAHHFVFDFLPSLEALLHEHLWREGEGFFGQAVEFFLIVAESRTESAKGVCGAEDDGIAQFGGGAACAFDVLAGFALDGLDVDFVQAFHEEFAVFGVHDGLHGCAEHLQVIFFEDAALVEFHTAVEGGLSAEGQHDAVGVFLLDDLFNEEGGHGEEVYTVGHALGRLDGGNIGVDQNGLNAFFLESLESLRTRIVKFASLTDFESAGT